MADKVKLTYSGDEGVVSYDIAREGYSAKLEHGDYEVSEALALRLLQTHGWEEAGGEGELTKKAQESGLSPRFSTDPGGEASETNPGDVRYWEAHFAEKGEKYPPDPSEEGSSGDSGQSAPGTEDDSPGPSASDRPLPGSTTGGLIGGRRARAQEGNDSNSEEGGNS